MSTSMSCGTDSTAVKKAAQPHERLAHPKAAKASGGSAELTREHCGPKAFTPEPPSSVATLKTRRRCQGGRWN